MERAAVETMFMVKPPSPDIPGLSYTYLLTERCELNPPAYFEGCLAHFGRGPNDYSEEIWGSCLPYTFGDPVPWMSCTPQPPTCQ